MFKQKTAVVGGLLLAAGLAGAAPADTITYGTYLSSHHATNVTSVEPWMRAVEAATDNSITFNLLSDGTIVSGRDSLQGVRDGLIDMSTIVDFYTPNELRSSSVLTGLAMLGEDEAVMTGAINEMQLLNCPSCLSDAAENNLRVLAIYSSSPYHMICNKNFETVEDFQGARIRATGAWALFVTALGATPVNITSGEMYEGLQRGQIDCTVMNVPGLTNYSLYEVATHVIDLPMGTFHGAHVYNMNTDVWARRSDEERAAMIDNIPLAMANLVEGARLEAERARVRSEEAGVIFTAPDQGLIDALAAFRADELARVTELARSRNIENPEDMLATFVDLLAKWEDIVAGTDGDWDNYAAALQANIYDRIE